MNREYFRTVLLNLAFIFIYPGILSYFLPPTNLVFFIYIALYSLVEVVIDDYYLYKKYNNALTMISLTSPMHMLEKFGTASIVNFILLFGSSIIIANLHFVIGRIPLLAIVAAWILLISKLEVILDGQIIRS